ncbi:dTDP-glucose 4,6-dehydratase [Rhizobiaceae bacterium n13]|uniref:dTDP-glucose 4,6-dehydratase n=1 Tax=Ferirhizobium litorale TaxID=2927786 RepID=UPI0024B2864D|nr:dTDP-glucose 4,6-dehydratase [Fererhizobium litorale]MDI7865227.1 dTDP-glucose 4,6-dehydratase [Fererhizobium litorale]
MPDISQPGPDGVAGAPARRIFVTGGAGFIGSAVCRQLVADGAERVVNVDKLTYAGNLDSLRMIEGKANYVHYRADICNERDMLEIMRREEIDAVMHLAAESHVDRSIETPDVFIETNIVGTVRLLNAALTYWSELGDESREHFRFHHVSTDEVFGDLPFDGSVFTEDTAYAPSSPYAASKAGADHLVRAWGHTYGLPVVLSNCSNNFGPYQFPEKFIPLAIINAIEEKPLPVYGCGENVRDWLHVEDHARALELVVRHAKPGESFNIGARAERSNLAVVEGICDYLDARRPRGRGRSHRDLIAFVPDRPGHDLRYAVDPSKIEKELGWRPQSGFDDGLRMTVEWYLENRWWWEPIQRRRRHGTRLRERQQRLA